MIKGLIIEFQFSDQVLHSHLDAPFSDLSSDWRNPASVGESGNEASKDCISDSIC